MMRANAKSKTLYAIFRSGHYCLFHSDFSNQFTKYLFVSKQRNKNSDIRRTENRCIIL